MWEGGEEPRGRGCRGAVCGEPPCYLWGSWAGGSCPRAPKLPADGSEDFKEYVYEEGT